MAEQVQMTAQTLAEYALSVGVTCPDQATREGLLRYTDALARAAISEGLPMMARCVYAAMARTLAVAALVAASMDYQLDRGLAEMTEGGRERG